MAARLSTLLLLGASSVIAGPLAGRQDTTATVTASSTAPSATPWDSGAVHEYPIHESCNSTQRAYLETALGETMTLCRQARDHILRWGNESEIYQKYFGDAPTGEPIGWFTKIVDGDKSDILFRCDNIDGNCAQKGWAGHWRGSNATSETVICDLSYEIRRPLSGMCMFGYDVANGATNYYWASDLLHRLLHVPRVGEGIVEHYGHGEAKYPGVIEMATENTTYAVRNSDTLQYFALEVYAHDIAVPGEGCPGEYRTPSPTSTPAAATSTAAAATSAAPATTTTEATEACEPHGDHWHCPEGVPEPTSPPS